MGIRLPKITLNHVKDEHFLLLLGENIHGIHGGTDTVLSDRYIESCVGTQIFYLDAKTLYGCAMSQYLPKGEFEQLTLDELQQQIQLIIQPPQKQVWLFLGMLFGLPTQNQTSYGKPTFVSLSNTTL